MTNSIEQDLRYPIGHVKIEGDITADMITSFINDIKEAPINLQKAVEGLSDEQLNTPYRPEGWTVRQVAHHLPDSHMNSYIRFKLALTEDSPVIKPYNEAKWAELPDSFNTPVLTSIDMLTSLHSRWVNLLNSLSPSDLKKTFRHPESGLVTLEKAIAIYAWHGKHHVAHITSLRQRMGW
jgi:uncharacterized damage-inducible protein DinB